jgi:hypothetical protein
MLSRLIRADRAALHRDLSAKGGADLKGVETSAERVPLRLGEQLEGEGAARATEGVEGVLVKGEHVELLYEM